MSRVLEFKEKTETLSLDELKQTIKAKDIGRTNIEHVDIIEIISEIMDKNGIKYELQPIVATGGKNVAYIERVEEQFGKKSLEASLLNKVFARFKITNFMDALHADEIRFNFNDKGFELAYGKLVLVCTNGATMFRGDTLSNYGKDKLSFDKIKDVFGAWMVGIEEKSTKYIDVINNMQKLSIDSRELIYTIGELQEKAVRQAYLKGPDAPFNIGQVSSFTKALLEEESKLPATVWDLYNVGTSIMQPVKMDTENIISSNVEWSEYLINKFKLN